jgi:hypothetical protein
MRIVPRTGKQTGVNAIASTPVCSGVGNAVFRNQQDTQLLLLIAPRLCSSAMASGNG